MIKNLLSVLFIGASLFSFGQASSYPNGSTVANFTVTDTDGNTHTLYDITATGKYVFLDFFFVDCVPCQQTVTHFNELYDKYGCNAGDIYCISINNGNDNNTQVDGFEATHGGAWHHPPAISNQGGCDAVDAAFGVGAYPTYCLIGPDNKMVANDIWPVSNVSTFVGALPITPTVMACSFAGVQENSVLMRDLLVYPNPASETLNISFEAAESTNAVVEIVSMVGQVIYSENVATTSGSNVHPINIKEIATGQYIARIIMNDQMATMKFSKE